MNRFARRRRCPLSTIPTKRPASKTRPTPRDADPFRYGWRHVPKIRPYGTEVFDQVPLTLEDVLHPEVGDFIVQTDPHDSDLAYLKAVFKARLTDNPTAVVLSDCRVDWNIPGVKPLGPDVAVFFGVSRHIAWATFSVAIEKAKPALVIEVTSPDTRKNGVGIKKTYYHRAGVPLYGIADVFKEKDNQRRIKLIGYSRKPTRYQRIKPDQRGFIWLAPVRLWLGTTRDPQGGFDRLACFDPDTGQEVGDYTAIWRQLAEAKQDLADAQKRILELEAQLKKSRS